MGSYTQHALVDYVANGRQWGIVDSGEEGGGVVGKTVEEKERVEGSPFLYSLLD